MLRRYPVKSMLGEDLAAGEVTAPGLAGDRVLGLVHRETGKIASAKNPRLWRAPAQAARRVSRHGRDDHASPTVPSWPHADPGIEAALSEFLDQPVTLAATPPPGAALDRADPEEVLRDGIRAGSASRPASSAAPPRRQPSSTSRRCT